MAFRTVLTPESSNITKFSYSAKTNVMHIEFKGGAVYSYKNVPPAVAGELLTCESVGSYFSKNIRPVYETIRIATPCGVDPNTIDDKILDEVPA